MVESVGRPHDFHSVACQALCIVYLVLSYNIYPRIMSDLDLFYGRMCM